VLRGLGTRADELVAAPSVNGVLVVEPDERPVCGVGQNGGYFHTVVRVSGPTWITGSTGSPISCRA
jgi:hypothetical protein